MFPHPEVHQPNPSRCSKMDRLSRVPLVKVLRVQGNAVAGYGTMPEAEAAFCAALQEVGTGGEVRCK